ncbi:MAG TPA: DUF2207 domain-containing protein [Terriglobales bacterium]|nr:DUF2207 domain-containing protein [Terriglobales bacterium]
MPSVCSWKNLRSTFQICILLLLLALPITVHARNWRIADFHSSVAIDKDGNMVSIERISLVFVGAYNGIYRSIPIDYPGPRGSNYRLFLHIDSVTDDQGQPLRYESKRDGPYRKLKIYIPGATDTTKTVLLTYSSPNAVRFFDDHDEFYWNVTGNDWPVPIDHASAIVSLPPGTTGLRAQAFTGVYGSHDREATSEVEDSRVNFETTNPLPMRGGLTIDVYIPKGILHQPNSLTRAWWFLKANPVLLVPFWTFAVMFLLWYYKGRDPDPGISVAPMYEPPKGMTPAETGALIDDGVQPRDVTCTLVDLAVRGYVKIKEIQEKVLLFTHKDYEFTLLKPMPQWGNDLAPHERVMLENVFQGGEVVRLSSLKNRFYTAIPVIQSDIMSALKSKDMYLVDPDSAHVWVLFGLVVIAAPIVITQFLNMVSWLDAPLLAFAAIAISVLIVWLFGRQMVAKTVLGARTRIQILGFQEFMNRVDADRLKRMPPDTFEKFLPYAMALGVEHRWAQAFAGIVQNPPQWYAGPDGFPGAFNPIFFTNSMHSMSTDMHEVFTSAPRASSTGSGWSGGDGGGGGGGFSGGGFGGGGGDAF